MVSLRDVVHHDILNASLACCLSNNLSHSLGIAIHGAVADNQTRLGFVFRHLIIHADDLSNMLVPYRTMSRADVVELYASQLLQRILYRNTVFANDIRIVAHHFEPECVAVDVVIDNSAIQRTKASEGIAREEHLVLSIKSDHGFWPMNHRNKHERKLVVAKVQSLAILNLHNIFCYAIEAFEHAESLLVAHNLDVRIILLDECDRTAMVWLHMVDDEIVDIAVAYHLVDILKILCEEIHLYCIYQCYLFIIDDVGVVAYSIRQRPKTLETMLVAIVDAYIINVACNFHNHFSLTPNPSP